MEKPENPVGKSNGLRHPIWEAVLWFEVVHFFTLFSLFSFEYTLLIVAGRSPTSSIFCSFMFYAREFHPGDLC